MEVNKKIRIIFFHYLLNFIFIRQEFEYNIFKEVDDTSVFKSNNSTYYSLTCCKCEVFAFQKTMNDATNDLTRISFKD